MTTLAVEAPRTFEVGDINDLPVIAADIIYQGAAVGENGAGYARPLVGGDRFLGFATSTLDNSSGAAGARTVRLACEGAIVLSISGLVITDVGLPVYATDDATFSLSPVGGSFIGRVKRFVSSGVGVVWFDVDDALPPDAWLGWTAEAVATSKTLDAEDTAKLFVVSADAGVITLPAITGMRFAVMNGGADGTVVVTLSPNSADGIKGPDLGNTDDKDLLNTKATARRGDFVIVEYGDATGWIVSAKRGIWAKE